MIILFRWQKLCPHARLTLNMECFYCCFRLYDNLRSSNLDKKQLLNKAIVVSLPSIKSVYSHKAAEVKEVVDEFEEVTDVISDGRAVWIHLS